jgi:hypothetical protein
MSQASPKIIGFVSVQNLGRGGGKGDNSEWCNVNLILSDTGFYMEDEGFLWELIPPTYTESHTSVYPIASCKNDDTRRGALKTWGPPMLTLLNGVQVLSHKHHIEDFNHSKFFRAKIGFKGARFQYSLHGLSNRLCRMALLSFLRHA